MTPGSAQDTDLPAKVPRRYVGRPASTPPPAPDSTAACKPDRARDKLLLVVGAIVVVVALLVVPGVLNRGGHNPVAAAAEATSNAPGLRVTFTATAHGPTQVSISGKGLINGEQNRARIEMSAGGVEAFGLAEVIDDGDIYVRSPQLNGVFGADKTWMLIRAQVFGDLFGTSSSGVGAGMSASPTQQLQALEDASEQVSEVGRERVGGVETTHYTAIIDLDELADQLKSRLSGEFGDLVDKSMEQVSSQSVDVWIDDRGLLRRETSLATMGSLGSFEMAMDLTDYGIHPDIAIPSPAEVYDATPLMQRALEAVEG
jgi:hypothetical protein